MKRVVAFAAAGALALSAFAGVAGAAPGNGNAYGKDIKDSCEASFGQLRQLSPHPVTPSSGAKNFATSANGVAFHCG